MSSSLDSLVVKIRSISDVYCENQMYCWPEFNPLDPNPKAFFKKRGIEFDGELFIRYPIKKTFAPIGGRQLEQQERTLGVTLPIEYKQLLQKFGPLHLPGKANIMIESPEKALRTTRCCWCYEGTPLSALAISPFNESSDGNSIGLIRDSDSFLPEVYEFDHEKRYKGDDPSLWTTKVGASLADFLLEYLDHQLSE